MHMKKLILTLIIFLPFFVLATTQNSNEEANPREANCISVLELLHSLGADINKQNYDGQTPLHLATRSPNGKTINKLLELGADPNIVDSNGETPLFNFFRYCEIDDRSLREYKQLWNTTDKLITNNKGETILDIIKQRYLFLQEKLIIKPKYLEEELKLEIEDYDIKSQLKALEEFLSENNLLKTVR